MTSGNPEKAVAPDCRSGREAVDLEHVPLPIFLVDSDFKLLSGNQYFHRLISTVSTDEIATLTQIQGLRDFEWLDARGPLKRDAVGQERICRFTDARGRDRVWSLVLAPFSAKVSKATVVGLVHDMATITQSLTGIGLCGGKSGSDSTGSDRDPPVERAPAIEKSSLLAEITYQIAHELRNPCAIIGGFAALLKGNLDPADKNSEYAKIIMEEVLRVEKALTEVLDYSKTFSEERYVNDLNELAVAAHEALRVRGDYRRQPCNLALRKEPVYVCVNRDQAVQSLYDVLGLLAERLDDTVGIRMEVVSGGQRGRIEIHFEASVASGNVEQHLADLFACGTQAAGLRLTLAEETIRHNGGELGLAGRPPSGTYLYVEYPTLERENVANHNVC